MANFEPVIPLSQDVAITFRQLTVTQLNGFSIGELKQLRPAQVGGRPPDLAIPAVPPAVVVPPVPLFQAPPAVEPPPAPQALAPVVANIFVIPAKEQMVLSAF